MNTGNRPVGPFGAALLAVTAVVGVALAVHGWSGRHLASALGSVGVAPTATASKTPRAASSAQPGPAGPHATTPAHGPASSPAPSAPGPLLSSQQYAQYAFQVWPGTLTSQARAAITGLSIVVHGKPGGIAVTAGVTGQAASAPVFYSGGAHVYVIEAALGDDSGNSDFNLGDDGIVVTDARGRILR